MKKALTLDRWSFYVICTWCIIALFAPLLANDKPIVLVDDDGMHFPAVINYKTSFKAHFQISPPIPYHFSSIDFKNANSVSPFDKQNVDNIWSRHWLGTDELGRDVLAGMIYGSRTALFIGVGSMFIAFIIGITLGSMAAYFGDDKIKFTPVQLVFSGLFFILYVLYVFTLIPWQVSTVSLLLKLTQLFISTFLLFWGTFLVNRLLRKNATRFLTPIPVDLIINRLIEILESIPVLIVLIALSATLKPSVFTVILIIGLVAWPSMAKFCRAEILKIKDTNYISNSKALGFTDKRILTQHILPNAISPLIITVAFGLAATVLLESTLSFMGMGITSDTASWGQILSSARHNYEAWWLAIFPGIAIFLVVVSCNHLGNKLHSMQSN